MKKMTKKESFKDSLYQLPNKIKALILCSIIIGTIGCAFGISTSIFPPSHPQYNQNTTYFYYYNYSYPNQFSSIDQYVSYFINFNYTPPTANFIVPPNETVTVKNGFYLFGNETYECGLTLWTITVFGNLILSNATIICDQFIAKGHANVTFANNSNIMPMQVQTRITSEGQGYIWHFNGLVFEDYSGFSFDNAKNDWYYYNVILPFDRYAVRSFVKLQTTPFLFAVFCWNSYFIF